ncbi:hypothetical protein LRX75_18410 [Rhizobium sp. DKSPLA3]|uniref:Uncharacterized protein n=1 Tax=Rhizobium quercicola TaxID=2901226 RepID=A0A9X1T1T0_9HYPH|nr:hypothetical protein [Rhizobium quercicola]MCD7111011.1 hypothetical protein [Rhizobium quercicola]
MKIADSHYTSYKPAARPQFSGFEQIGLPRPGGRPETLDPRAGGGTGADADASMAAASTVNLSAAFWAISAEKLEKRAADVEKAAQAVAAKATADKAATREAFLDLAGKSVAEKVRAQFLKDRNLSEDDLAAMDPAARKALEEEITEAVKRQLDLEDDVVQGPGASGQSAAPRDREA